jgi:hypothetical protein
MTAQEHSKIKFEAFGVRVGIEVNDARALERVQKIVPMNSTPLLADADTEHNFRLIWGEDETKEDALYKGDEEISRRVDTERLVAVLDTYMRMTIGEYAPNFVFLHAGVVAWEGEGLIFPAKSFSGKTTLVAELIKKGALYYSDEYAVIDQNGLLHPYPKPLSIRKEGEHAQTDRSVDELGGRQGMEPVPVKLVFLTEFERNAEWLPQILTPGQGVMELLPHALGLRCNPEFTFKVLNLIGERAIIASSKRGEISDLASRLLKFAG